MVEWLPTEETDVQDRKDDLTDRIINHPTSRAMRADFHLRNWRKGTLNSRIFTDPDEEPVIVAITISVADDEERARWIEFVRGDGTDPHRVALAKACSAQPFSFRAF